MSNPRRSRRVTGRTLLGIGLSAVLALAVAPPTHAAPGDAEAHSSAQAVRLNLGGALTVAASQPATAAHNDGTGSIAPVHQRPATSVLGGQSLLSAGALSETAQADTDGSSYACAGILSPDATLQIGERGQSCTVAGATAGGFELDLAALPGVSLTSGIASITLVADAIVAHAHDDGAGTQAGDASMLGLKARVEVFDGILGGLLGGLLPPIEVPITVSGAPNQNLLTAIVNALTGASNPLLAPVVDLLSGAVAGAVSLTANYQRTADGVLTVSALHVGVLSDALLDGDLAKVTVGKNMAPTDCHPFPDVTIDNPFCHDIDWLKKGDMTRGYQDGNYRPTSPVTRQAMSAFLYRFSHQGTADPTCTVKPFPDVETDHEFCGAITWMEDSKIGRGYDDGKFGPAKPVSRQATAAFLYRLTHNGQDAPACTAKPFGDVPVTSQFCGAIQWFKDKGIAEGYSAAEFGVTRPVSRQAMAAWIHRYSSMYPLPS